MLIVAGSFAALGFLALLLTAYFQWRIVSRLAEISAALPFGHALGAGPGGLLGRTTRIAWRSARRRNRTSACWARSSGSRSAFMSWSTRPACRSRKASRPRRPARSRLRLPAAEPAAEEGRPDAARITVLLGKGQSLLNLDQAEEALACFDEVLALDANHPEALVKKGAALERLRKLDEAVACYDRAIAADSSLTVAYLYKGGLFNRMERFSEALECYEQALRTQETRRG